MHHNISSNTSAAEYSTGHAGAHAALESPSRTAPVPPSMTAVVMPGQARTGTPFAGSGDVPTTHASHAHPLADGDADQDHSASLASAEDAHALQHVQLHMQRMLHSARRDIMAPMHLHAWQAQAACFPSRMILLQVMLPC